jgi:hypothetical protein
LRYKFRVWKLGGLGIIPSNTHMMIVHLSAYISWQKDGSQRKLTILLLVWSQPTNSYNEAYYYYNNCYYWYLCNILLLLLLLLLVFMQQNIIIIIIIIIGIFVTYLDKDLSNSISFCFMKLFHHLDSCPTKKNLGPLLH